MKKLALVACLVAAVALSGPATAGASTYDWGTCYYSCGERLWTDRCCGSQIQCSDGSTGYALFWEDIYFTQHVCMI